MAIIKKTAMAIAIEMLGGPKGTAEVLGTSMQRMGRLLKLRVGDWRSGGVWTIARATRIPIDVFGARSIPSPRRKAILARSARGCGPSPDCKLPAPGVNESTRTSCEVTPLLLRLVKRRRDRASGPALHLSKLAHTDAEHAGAIPISW
jgi:hypothetical protein